MYEEQNPYTGRRTRGAGLRNLAALLAVALVSIMAGAGGAYLVIENHMLTAQPAEQPSSAAPLTTPEFITVSGDLSAVVDKTAASVVEIYTESMRANYFGQYITEGAGSGVIYTADGYIVTNNHVISGAQTITVRSGTGEEYEAALVGTDEQTDLALLKIEAKNLSPVTMADSDKIRVGEVAVAIGNPLGTLGGSVTSGIISAKDRQLILDNQTMTLLQTSAAVNPGNSGGGLFNAYGQLIGIINAKSSGESGGTTIEGLGFAIPSNMVEKVARDIMKSGYVKGRPQIGASVREIRDLSTAAMYGLDRLGVYILEITVNGNNLQSGDLIFEAGGVEISTNAELATVINSYEVGDSIEMKIIRAGKETTVYVPLSERVPEHIRRQIKAA